MKQDIYNIPEGYKNSPLGIIPNEWEVERLGNIVSITSGESPSLYTLTSHGKYPFIKVEDMNNCEKYQIRSREYSNDEKNIIHKESIIFPKRGAAILNNKVRIAKVDIQMDSNMMAIKPNNKVLPEYLFYSITFEQLFRIADTSTIPQINNKHINPYKILLPPLNEQRKIAEVLSTWDKAIEKQTLLIEKLELRKKGLMQQLLTGKKRLPGFNGVAWKKVKLDEVTTFLSNNSLSRDNLNTLRGSILNIHYGDVLIKLPTIVDVSLVDLPFINEELNIVSKDYVSEGDIIMADTAEDGTVGKACEVVNVGNNKVVSGLHTILIHPTIAFAPMFLGYYLNSKEYHKQILSIMQGIKVYSITKDALRKTNIKIPPLEEQNAIAEILSVCDNEITLAKQKLDTLRLQKKGLMQVLLTGKKRVEL